ncbi:MAG: trypsin-like peptidase domain-containing protein [Candidatus Woesearchaeota archaeon]|nr:trypsin-like peptidase domain-containing protein [Candidatus Woesearchaeota archaeon]
MLIIDNKREVVTVILLFAIITGSFVLYGHHQTRIANAELTGQLSAIQGEMRERYDRVDYEIKRLAEDVDAKTYKIKQDLYQQKEASSGINEQFSALQKETQSKIGEITGQLNRAHEDGQRIDEFEKQLKQVSADSSDFSSIIQNGMPSVVSVETLTGKASGTIISDDGYIVTSKHVIGDARAVVVQLYNKNALQRDRFTARVAGVNDGYDLAVLKIEPNKKLKPLPIGDSKKTELGEKVFALGNPGAIGFTATEGIISAVDRYVGNIPYFQTDSPINIGNSGGPLINRRGEMVGLNTLKIVGLEGVSLALPSYIVDGISRTIIKNDAS